MKKFLKLIILVLILFPTSSYAKSYSKDEIGNGSYIIGNYLFNKETSSSYNGTLTTPMIMLSSKSINSNNLNDMKIYYKNSRGKWINAITNEVESNVPSSFEIDCINLNCKNSIQATSVNSIKYTKDIVSNGSYIIGNYLFNKETNSLYAGTLTTQMIMLSSKSINSNKLSDMKIYYKNSRGKWINTIDNSSISSVPSSFDVGYVNMQIVSNTSLQDDNITITLKSAKYDGKAKNATFSSKSGLTVTPIYYSDSSCKTKTTSSNATGTGGAPKVVGTYYATATTPGNSTYKTGKLSCSKAVVIEKGTSSLSLNATTGTLTYGNAASVSITKVGDGALSCQSSDKKVATCSISGKILTVVPQVISSDSKKATITVNIQSTDNYNSASVTYTAVVNRINYSASSNRNIDPSKWVATDKLGRTIAMNGDYDKYKKGSIGNIGSYGTKKVGIFYWDWHLELQESDPNYKDYDFNARSLNKRPVNLSNLINDHPELKNDYGNALWKIPEYDSKYYWWNEPIYGYYTESDNYVIRKQAELLADAGIDFIVLDCTNGSFLWEKAYMNIFKVFKLALNDGVNVPKIVFMLNFNGSSDEYATQINKLYDNMYNNKDNKEKYQDLWFKMDGDTKPLILGGNPTSSKIKKGVKNTFTFRTSIPEYTFTGCQGYKCPTSNGSSSEIKWGWLSTYEQAYYMDLDGNIEQSTVGVAQNFSASTNVLSAMNGPDIMGRSYAPGYSYTYRYRNQDITIGDHPQGTLYGRNFEHQWEYVRKINPNYVFVTGWNEWIAGREQCWDPNVNDDVECIKNAFPDQFNDEYSRDIEPSKGSLKDNYYYQLVSNVRKYKGANKQEKQPTSKTIDIYGDPGQWADNNLLSYNSYTTIDVSTSIRNSKMWGFNSDTYYTNNTFRNDIRTAKVSYDSNNLYFYVETVKVISGYKDKFRLLLDTVDCINNPSTNNWNEFEYVINRTGAKDDTFTLEKISASGKWETVGRVKYNVVSNTLQIEVPLNLLKLNASNLNFNFKWTDNNMGDMTNVDDIMSIYTDGDAAPGGRFAFNFYNK